jgi:hypothetical protein
MEEAVYLFNFLGWEEIIIGVIFVLVLTLLPERKPGEKIHLAEILALVGAGIFLLVGELRFGFAYIISADLHLSLGEILEATPQELRRTLGWQEVIAGAMFFFTYLFCLGERVAGEPKNRQAWVAEKIAGIAAVSFMLLGASRFWF